jgi:hypothetical protein
VRGEDLRPGDGDGLIEAGVSTCLVCHVIDARGNI